MYIITQMDQNANNLAKFFPQNGRSRISLRSVGIQTTSPFVGTGVPTVHFSATHIAPVGVQNTSPFVGAHSQFGCMVAHFFAVVCGRFMNRPYGKHPYENQPKADVLFFSYIRLAASSMHKCVICPSDVVCASRVGSYKANIISL